jgi:16S rRNA (guanine527-N7)-methyltransferase
MDSSRIADLLAPFFEDRNALGATQLDQISTYIDLLLRWNSRVNLTAIRTPDEIVTRHFGESLFTARQLFPQVAGTPPPEPNKNSAQETPADGLLVDIGSGAGFPGLPIKIWFPKTRITLIESNNKKVAFLREVIRALTLTDIDVFPNRAESFPPASAATVTLRAVERFDQILPAAIRLLTPTARLVLLISETQLPQIRTSALHWFPSIPIPLSTSRIVAIASARH